MNKRMQVYRVQSQSGAALLVSMVLIFMLSILGIGAMRDATLEGQLASNAVQKEITFQAAESATDTVLAIEDGVSEMAVETTICQETPNQFDLGDLNKASSQETSVQTQYGGQSLPTGWSLGGPIGGRRFVVTGVSTLTTANTSTTIAQGVVAIGAVEAGVEC